MALIVAPDLTRSSSSVGQAVELEVLGFGRHSVPTGTSAASDLRLRFFRRSIHRPNGPGDPSPGLRPEADALGKKGTSALRPERPREPGSTTRGWKSSRDLSGRTA